MITSKLDADAKRLLEKAKEFVIDSEFDFEHVLLAELEKSTLVANLISETNEVAATKSIKQRIEKKAKGSGTATRLISLVEQLQGIEQADANIQSVVELVTDNVSWTHVIAAIVATQSRDLNPLLVQDCELSWQKIMLQPDSAQIVGVANSLSDQDSLHQLVAEFTNDLTQVAREDLTRSIESKKLGQLIGREKEVGQVMAILLRKRSNNPVLIGEAGVGKTQIVEGLATRIAQGNVPAKLIGKSIKSIDITSLVSDTRYRGQFAEKIKAILEYAKALAGDSIFFIDEIHNLMGLGGASGSNDAANMLKPALSRGELWCIGATTFDEFNQLEKDPAMRRRFQSVIVDEQSVEEVREIVDCVAPSYEQHHSVEYPLETRDRIVKLARRYIGDIRSPAREVGLMDEVGAHFALYSKGEDSRKRIEPEDISKILQARTGIPIGIVDQDMRDRLIDLQDQLGSRVFGQDEAIAAIDRQCRVSFAGLADPNEPRAILFFAGPSGVGKTELAKAVAESLYGSEQAMIRLDMSEFSDASAKSKLIGSDPGLIGYEEGGRLTEAVRRKPFSLILLDEFEKAHPTVWRLFLQVFGEGRLTDNKGRMANFKESIIVITSNAGSAGLSILARLALFREEYSTINENSGEDIASFSQDYWKKFKTEIDSANLSPLLKSTLQEEAAALLTKGEFDDTRIVEASLLATPGFPTELFSRIGQPIVFPSLKKESLLMVLEKNARQLVETLLEQRTSDFLVESRIENGALIACGRPRGVPGFEIVLEAETVDYLLETGSDPLFGARAIINVFKTTIRPLVANRILEVDNLQSAKILRNGLQLEIS